MGGGAKMSGSREEASPCDSRSRRLPSSGSRGDRPAQVGMLDEWTGDGSQKGKGRGGNWGPRRKHYPVTANHAGCHHQAGAVARPAQGCRHKGVHTCPACRYSAPRPGPCNRLKTEANIDDKSEPDFEEWCLGAEAGDQRLCWKG